MGAIGTAVRKVWLLVVLLLGVALNLAQRDVEGTLVFVAMAAIATAFLIPDEQRKLQLVANAVGIVAVLAMLVPRLYSVADRL